MTGCLFVSDLHGSVDRYRKLLAIIRAERPEAVFLGGDLLPSGLFLNKRGSDAPESFVEDFLARRFENLKRELGSDYPRIFLILGNDDPRVQEDIFKEAASRDLWEYVHNRRVALKKYSVYGYANLPPTPFQLKDWERYDVSRYTDPGCVSPEDGFRTVPVSVSEARYSTIKSDLDRLVGDDRLEHAIFLFHSPPYETHLDRAALDNKMVDHVPLDVNVGSIAIRQFIEERQPHLTLHGHVHESARITGSWRDRIGRTHLFGAAHNGTELALVRFPLEVPEKATRELV